MKVVTVVGARPQFIKAAVTDLAVRNAGHEHVLIHTGQHYDFAMSEVFFRELGMPAPKISLNVGSQSHCQQTGDMLTKLGEVLQAESPDWVLVFGDTNSTLAGALAARQLRIPLAHVEAGMRSFNRSMPEELNRVLTDHCSDLLFCASESSAQNLAKEGLTEGVHVVGDTMMDAVVQFAPIARKQSDILHTLKLQSKKYLLATLHRAYNTDEPSNLDQILTTLSELEEPVIMPLHPRTRQRLATRFESTTPTVWGAIRFIEPVSYFDMLMLQENARLILTDSGGMQKEAYYLGTPCITLRPETEWVETVSAGWNVLAAADPDKIRAATKNNWPTKRPELFGAGDSAKQIAALLHK